MKIGFFRHWFQPAFRFADFLADEGIPTEKIDFSQKNYLEPFDVALVEQNGFDDYLENDELYVRDWIRRGGILLFMHQDWRRWAPYFLPEELGYTQLILRHTPTIRGDSGKIFHNVMMPRVERGGRRLFSEPNPIPPEDFLGWKLRVNTFGIVRDEPGAGMDVNTAALSCFQTNPAWQVLGSYRDPAVRDAALVLQAKYGKGLVFLNQILFPETADANAECLAFWKKYVPNLLAHLERFRRGDAAAAPEVRATLPLKSSYAMTIHMHSLDWYGCDSSAGTIEAVMRKWKFDICALALKDVRPYKDGFDLDAYSSGRVLFLHGQEYHPFNWNDSNAQKGHNTYHILAIGMDGKSYTPEFTRSLFSDSEIDSHLKKAIGYIHEHGGAACATHPYCDYWKKYPFDAVDMEPLTTVCGTAVETQWLSGNYVTLMNSVDLFGVERMEENPAANFIMTGGVPDRENVVSSVKAGRVVAAAFFQSAEVRLDGHRPGDVVPLAEAQKGCLHISAEVFDGTLAELRVYSGRKLIGRKDLSGTVLALDFPLSGLPLERFVRVEISGTHRNQIAVSNPFRIG